VKLGLAENSARSLSLAGRVGAPSGAASFETRQGALLRMRTLEKIAPKRDLILKEAAPRGRLEASS
jgi:hypothetical protein